MKLFFDRETSGSSSSNLQLFSLIQATIYWQKTKELFQKERENSPHLIEHYVFIIACLGLSISQLLGQNYSEAKDKLPEVGVLWGSIFKKSSEFHQNERKKLQRKFDELIGIYNKCRHFGITRDDVTHLAIANLTFEQVAGYVGDTYRLWDAIIAVFHEDPQNYLAELKDLGIKQVLEEIIEDGDYSFQLCLEN